MTAPYDDPAPHCLVNGRDLGGLRTRDGETTSAGVLYRTDAPYPGDVTPAWAPQWPPHSVIDLRSRGENESEHPLADEAELFHLPLLRRASVVTGSDPVPVVGPDETLLDIYERILTHHPDRLARIVQVAATSAGPALVHCAAGKDRTGAAVALLLLAANVDPAEIVADYVQSETVMPALIDRLERLGVRRPGASLSQRLLKSPPEAIEFIIGRFLSTPGGIPEWLERNGTPAKYAEAWRQRFVVGA